jgi:predicted ester cyclase
MAVILLVLGGASVAVSGCGGAEAPPPQGPPAAAASSAPPVATAEPAAPPAASAPPKTSLAELELASAKAFADALNQHDPEKYAALFALDGVEKATGEPDGSGREAIAAHVKGLFTAFPDFKIGFSRIWQKGNFAAVSWAWNATDTGGFMGNKPSGRAVGTEGISTVVFTDDGLVKELHRYGDGATLMSQLDPKAKKGTFRTPPTLPTSTDVFAAAGSPDEDKDLDVAKGFYAALDDKKAADVMALFTEESTADDFTMPATLRGLKDWKKMYETYVGAFPDFKQAISTQVAVKDYVISEGVLNGTHRGALGPIRATGKPVSLHFVDVLQIKDGKLAHVWTWSNGAELLTEIGVLKAPGASPPSKSVAAAAKTPLKKEPEMRPATK